MRVWLPRRLAAWGVRLKTWLARFVRPRCWLLTWMRAPAAGGCAACAPASAAANGVAAAVVTPEAEEAALTEDLFNKARCEHRRAGTLGLRTASCA
jgi:hypothetical protein